MKFLPFEKYTLTTRLTVDEAKQRFIDNVEPVKKFRIRWFGVSSDKPYEGGLYGNNFKMNRIIGYNNSFLPIISGAIERNINQTEIQIKMRLSKAVLVFMCLWLGITGLIAIAVNVYQFTAKVHGTINFVYVVIFVFEYVICTGGFKYESSKSKRFLAELFLAEEVI